RWCRRSTTPSRSSVRSTRLAPRVPRRRGFEAGSRGRLREAAALGPRCASGYTACGPLTSIKSRGGRRMADWDVIAKQRLTEDWGTLRSSYLPLNQAMRRTVDFLEKGQGTFDEVMAVARERLEGSLMNLSALVNRRSPWVRLE